MYKEYLAKFRYSAKALKNSKVFFSLPTNGIYGQVRVNSFRNAIGVHYLPHSSEYVAPPSIDIVRPWFETIREKVVPYTRFLSLLMMHKMKEGYGDGNITPYPTQVFSVNNWALKPNQPEEPLFTNHMLAICNAAEPVVFKAPKPSSNTERVLQGIKLGAKSGHKKHSTSLKQPSVSSKEATKGRSSKAHTGSKTGHLKRKKESSSAMDSNPSQTLASTPVVAEMHKEDQQATGGPNSLGVTSKARLNPQLSSGCDDSADSTAKANPRLCAPIDFIPQQQGLETVLTQPTIGKKASSIARKVEEEESSRTIKLEDLEKLVSNVQTSFKDLDSPKDDVVIIFDDSDEDEEDEVHTTKNAKIKDTSVPKSSSPRSSQIQELTNQVLILQSQKYKLELEKNKAKAKAALLKAQPSFPNMRQLNELLVKSLQTEFLKISFAHDFSNSLPTELKDLPFRFNELTEEVKGLKKQVHELEIKLPRYLKEILTKLEDFTKTVTKNMNNQQSKPIPLIITTTTQMQSPIQSPPKSSFQPKGEHIKKDKNKKAMFLKEADKESTNSDSNDDDETHVTGFIVKPSTTKKLKKFDFITEYGRHIHLTEDEINGQKKLEKDTKAEAAKQEGEVRKAELVDLLGPEVGPITLKVYREDGTSKVISSFKASDLHLELGINLDIPLSEQDPLDKLNDLANKKKKYADDIHDYFKANKRLKTSVNLDIAEVDKRNLNLLKKMRTIKQLR
nr:hypothetical protein [Tanacetum cinerariifolium]